MYKILVTITCIVVLTIHWDEFTSKVDLAKILQVSKGKSNFTINAHKICRFCCIKKRASRKYFKSV